ncbi:MAG: pyridoxal phosphate-dependent aminotransferase [Planctomycetota bacterium]|nr:pyridoxal phosphate-dependent aminotransferase [Planctomycetota bacterium]
MPATGNSATSLPSTRIAARCRRMGTEAAFRVFARAKTLEAAGRDIIHLEMGEPDFPTPSFIRAACEAALAAGHTGYAPAAGLPALRTAVASYVARTRGIHVEPAQVVITPGAKAVIFFTYMALLEPGDEVIVPDPGFPIFESMADALGAVRVPWHPGSGTQTRPDLDRLDSLMGPKTKLLVLNSPGNPTGIVYTLPEIARIAELCVKHDVLVLSDEIYSRILFGGTHHSIAAQPGMAERTVLLDGFSKSWSMTGWRLGYAVAPLDIAAAFEKLMTNSASCAVHFVQHAALAALAGPADEVERMVAAFTLRRDALVDGLAALPGVRCDRPAGSFFAFADIRETGFDARSLADRLLEEAGVACVEGPAFGAGGAGHIRFSFAADVARIRAATVRMGALLRS